MRLMKGYLVGTIMTDSAIFRPKAYSYLAEDN